MATKIHTDCCTIQGEIQYCSQEHTYLHIPTKKKLTSVSKLIQTVYSTKTWDGVDQAIIENARERGEMVDRYMAQYVTDGFLTVTDIREDAAERLVIAHRIWESQFGGRSARSQQIVYSVEDGIAGMMDFGIDGEIIADLKCTYSVESSWVIQLGAYLTYHDGKRAGIIHVSPKVYPEGGRWLEYDVEECKRYYALALAWFKQTKSMEKFSRRPNVI